MVVAWAVACRLERPHLTRLRWNHRMADAQKVSDGWKPGDRRPDLHSMLRVDHAGEYGATRIYAGQLAVLRGSSPAAHLVTHMAAQEDRHLARFNHLLAERREIGRA